MQKFRSIFSRKNDLGFQILTLYTLFILPIVAFALIFDSIAGRQLREEIRATNLAFAQAIAKETSSNLSLSLYAVEQLSRNPAVIATDEDQMNEIFGQFYNLRPDLALIYRLDENGQMLFHYPVGPSSTVGVDFSFREYFQRALNTRQSLVSLGRISPTTSQPVATAIMPIWEGDRFAGVVGINLKLQYLSDILASISSEYGPDEQLQIVIVDSGGNVIATTNPDDLLTDYTRTAPAVTEALLNGESGNRVEKDHTGQEKLFGYIAMPDSGWGVIISRPTSVAFATPQNFHRGVLSLIVVFLGIGVFFWWALSVRVIRPVESLADYSHSIERDQPLDEQQFAWLQQYSNRKDQIGSLIRSFIHMEIAINDRIEELRTLLDTSAAVVSTLDSQAVLERILEQVEHLLDIEQSLIVALDPESGVFRARASRGMSEAYTRSLEISPDEFSSVSMRAIRLGGPIQISDTETDPTFTSLRPRARTEGYRSVTAIPLKTTHAPPSTLNVYSPHPLVFNKRELDLLSAFANQAAMAIENAELFARSDTRLQEQTRRLEAMIQSLEVGLVLEDLEGSVLYTNRVVSELTGLPLDRITGLPARHLFRRLGEFAADPADALKKINAVFSSTRQEECTIALDYPEGSRHIRLKGFTVSDTRGVEIGRGQILQDITREYEIDRMKTSLISTVSHELRTPLTSIKGYATTLLAEDIDWEAQSQKEFLEIISRDADRLSDIVDNLLDLSRIEAGNLTLSKVACSLADIIIEGVNRVAVSAARPIEIHVPDDLPPVYVDAYRIETVIRNLVENAIKYSDPPHPIRITAGAAEDRMVVQIEDRGPGISPQKANDIFGSFYRLDNGLTRRRPGVGLGLAICRGFIKAHGGEIWVEPREVGACFAFSIPFITTSMEEEAVNE